MALTNNSLLVPVPASGVSVASHTAAGKEHQAVVLVDHLGHAVDSRPEWLVWFTPATNAASRRVGDLFNADATKIVRVRGIWLIPTLTAITGVQIGFGVKRTTAVGTGGTPETPRPMDTNQSALDADITARSGASGGATVAYTYFQNYLFNDETNAGAGMVWSANLLPVMGPRVAELVLRQNQGLLIQQDVTATVGLTGALLYFVTDD